MTDHTTRDGSAWMPTYLTDINGQRCIGCGRCFKVCGQGVMHLYGVDEDGKVLGIVNENDDDDFDGELNRKIMRVDAAGACVGCGACGRVCAKNCQTHVAADTLAA